MAIPMLAMKRFWVCPNCDHTDVTTEAQPHTRFHHCPKLGITAPLVEDGTVCKVEAIEREDYIAAEDVRYSDTGRPVMAVRTTRTDGSTDVAVFAATATLNLRE